MKSKHLFKLVPAVVLPLVFTTALAFPPLQPIVQSAINGAATSQAQSPCSDSSFYNGNTPGKIQLQTGIQQIQVIRDKDGTSHSEIVPAKNVQKGAELIFTVNYENTGGGPLNCVVITDAIPAMVTYLPGTVQGDNAVAKFSVDGGKTWGVPAELKVKNPDGSMRDAQPADYSVIRWVIQGALAPGAKGVVSFHCVLK